MAALKPGAGLPGARLKMARLPGARLPGAGPAGAAQRLALACCAALALLLAASCARRIPPPVLPPETIPLSHEYVGYGVVNALYARLGTGASDAAPAAGHARMGTVARILERRLVMDGGRRESWLLIEAEATGWIREDLVDVFANAAQARAAAQAMR